MKIKCVAALTLLSLAGTASQAQVYSSDPALAIPLTGTVQDQITVSGGPASITSLSVVLDLSHTYTGDLDIVLVPPSGAEYIHLCSDVGGAGDNMAFTRFSMSGGGVIGTAGFNTAPFSADYIPEGGAVVWRAAATIPVPATFLQDISSLNGLDSNGTWTLILDDDAGGDQGVVNHWSLEFNGASDPLVPTIALTSATATPATIYQNTSTTIAATAQARGGATLTSVTVDASPIGQGTIALSDQGGGVWSATITGNASTPVGPATLTVTATPNAGTPGTRDVALEVRAGSAYSEEGDAGSLRNDAAVPAGSGDLGAIVGAFGASDVDVYLIGICQPGSFSASTVGGATVDTQLFLFNEQGFGVTFNDDTATTQSTISSQFIPQAGNYYLAISRYNIDPVDSGGALLWINTPFNVERAPDGPGASNAWEGWTGTNAATASYIIALSGACFSGPTGPVCNDIDFNNDGSFFDPQDIEAFLQVYSEGPCIPEIATCDDIDFNNDTSIFDPCDINSFLVVYSEGPCTPCGV